MAARMVFCEGEQDVTQKLCEAAGLTCVRVPMSGFDSIDEFTMMWSKWLDTDEAEGEFMVTNCIDGAWRPFQARLYFTHDPTAFAFKMRFG